MMITIDMTSKQPIYEQLKNKITRLAVSNVFEADYKLPSVRSLAKELMVNPNTVQKAYADLEREGIIYSVRGKGSFISKGVEQNIFVREEALTELKQSVNKCKVYKIDKASVLKVINQIYEQEVV